MWYGMNPSVSCCTSSEEQGGETSWVCESWALGNPAMSVGTLESARQTFHGGAAGRVDWDWDMNIATNNNPLLLSSHHRHHHHHHHHDHHDSDEHKPHLMPSASAPSFRQYNGVMGPFSGHQNHALGLLNSSGIRSFDGSNDGMNPPAPPSSFHPGLLYSEMPGFSAGGFGCGDSRSQLLGMMSMQQQAEHHHHHHKEGGFHDIVKREELCPGDFQARIGLNLGHRTYFSAEDTAVSRLYKRPRAIPPASQVPRCQAEGCKADLTNAKHYHRRHKVCEFHSKATSVVTGGVQQRFCQQCSRFHVLAEFDEVKRSCRKRLADHNRRRRKPQTNTIVPAVSSAEAATALKVEDDSNNVSGSCNNTSRGTVQASAAAAAAAPVLRTEAQALLNAMSLPLILQNTKGSQMNNNTNTTTANNNNNPMLQQANSQKVTVANQQYVQQQQSGGGGHKGPNLSLSSSSVGMSLCNPRQTTAQDYSGLELALPWLRTTSEYSGSNHRPPPAMDNILHPIISHEKGNVEAFSASSVQNFLPLSGSMSSRELGSSQWMVGSSDSASSLEAGQQMFSLLEPAEHQNRTDEQPQTARPVEYLSHRHQGGLNNKEPVDGNSEAKFSGMQNSLRPFSQSIYDGSM